MKTASKILIAKILFKILILFGFKKKIIFKRESIKWNLDLSEGIDLSIFLFGSFQENLVKSIEKLILKNKKINFFNIIDIGSNIGDKSLCITKNLLEKKFTKFKIFSIEPTNYAFNKQKLNINLNPNLKKKINLFKYFISNSKNKPKAIYSSWKLDENKNSHKVHKGILKKVDKYTKNISLDNFILKNKINDQIIIKIDVDGFEMDVLKSSIKTLQKKKPVIFMEYAPYSFEEHGSNTKEFFKFIKKYQYEIYDLNFNKLDKVKINADSSIDIILMFNKASLI